MHIRSPSIRRRSTWSLHESSEKGQRLWGMVGGEEGGSACKVSLMFSNSTLTGFHAWPLLPISTS